MNSDNTSLIKVQIRIGNTDPMGDADDGFVDIVGSKYGWTRSFLSNDYANADYATDNGDGTWTLPVYLRVYDYAGNVSTNEPSAPGGDSPYPTDLVALYEDRGRRLHEDPLLLPHHRPRPGQADRLPSRPPGMPRTWRAPWSRAARASTRTPA